MEVLVFKIDDRYYSIPVEQVVEIMTAAVVTCIPNAGQFVEGTFLFRGSVVPVLDLREYLGGQGSTSGVFIVTHVGSELLALHADAVDASLRVDSYIKADLIMQCDKHPILDGVFRREDQLVLELNLERIVQYVLGKEYAPCIE